MLYILIATAIEYQPNDMPYRILTQRQALTRSCSGPAARTLVAPDPGAHYGGSRSHFLIYLTLRGKKIIVHRLPTNRELMRQVVAPPTLKKLADGYMSTSPVKTSESAPLLFLILRYRTDSYRRSI
jgi:hypothetical protein